MLVVDPRWSITCVVGESAVYPMRGQIRGGVPTHVRFQGYRTFYAGMITVLRQKNYV